MINPKNGGNPPKDKKFRKIKNIMYLFDLIKYNWLIENNFI